VAKVTSKLQVTLPKALADRFGIQPGDDIEWEAAGDVLRIVPASKRSSGRSVDERLALFAAIQERQRKRERGRRCKTTSDRGWEREDLYKRGRAR
jgi:AbrB family looped-hinge helix DNA binding protein